jgi:hypothetical protein
MRRTLSKTNVIKMPTRSKMSSSTKAASVVSIMRPGPFGNPFVLTDVNDDCKRDECIDKFAKYFFAKLDKDKQFRNSVLELRGKTLGCCCKPKACHGDVIAWWLNEGAGANAALYHDATHTNAIISVIPGRQGASLIESKCDAVDTDLVGSGEPGGSMHDEADTNSIISGLRIESESAGKASGSVSSLVAAASTIRGVGVGSR